MGAFFMSQMRVGRGNRKSRWNRRFGSSDSRCPASQYNTRLRSVPGIAASFAFSSLAWASSALTSITT